MDLARGRDQQTESRRASARARVCDVGARAALPYPNAIDEAVCRDIIVHAPKTCRTRQYVSTNKSGIRATEWCEILRRAVLGPF